MACGRRGWNGCKTALSCSVDRGFTGRTTWPEALNLYIRVVNNTPVSKGYQSRHDEQKDSKGHAPALCSWNRFCQSQPQAQLFWPPATVRTRPIQHCPLALLASMATPADLAPATEGQLIFPGRALIAGVSLQAQRPAPVATVWIVLVPAAVFHVIRRKSYMTGTVAMIF